MTKTKKRRDWLTKGNAPETSPTARRTWGNTSECTHRWAANQYTDGRCGNVFFRDGIIFSYGEHFPMARHVKRGGKRFVLVTTRTYSVTTSGHLSDVKQAVRGQTVFYVHDVLARTRAEHLANFRAREQYAADQAAKAARARSSNRAFYLTDAAAVIKSANAYAAAVGLRQRLKEVDREKLEEWGREVATESRKRELRRTKEDKAAHAREVAEWEQRLAEWQNGGEYPGNCPDHAHPLYGLTFLRVRGSRLETTQRVVIPVSAALPVLKLIRSGESWDRTNHDANDGPKVDDFPLRTISQSGRYVEIGCHRVSFDEVERVAATIGA